jgi:peptidyl-prolyl cis-trans isomerase-like 4
MKRKVVLMVYVSLNHLICNACGWRGCECRGTVGGKVEKDGYHYEKWGGDGNNEQEKVKCTDIVNEDQCMKEEHTALSPMLSLSCFVFTPSSPICRDVVSSCEALDKSEELCRKEGAAMREGEVEKREKEEKREEVEKREEEEKKKKKKKGMSEGVRESKYLQSEKDEVWGGVGWGCWLYFFYLLFVC